ncbi:cupin domain-containing protein [Streptomyces sp. BI20]|uniref:cupin domain-containing protein n=1 Tax=Streptomyces sp. BI20 TaxID=3403460 RepID=UPI003C76D462
MTKNESLRTAAPATTAAPAPALPAGVVHTTAQGAERVSDAPGSVMALLADVAGLTCNLAVLEEGAKGAPVHHHTKATEFFFVLDGRLDVLVEEEILTLAKGDFLAVPAHVKHAFAPAAGARAEVFVGFAPGMGRFDYYRLLDRVRAGQADPAEIGASSPVYDNHYGESALWAGR